MGDEPNVCLKRGKCEALYENIPLKEQLLGPFVRFNFKGNESINKEEVKNGSNPQLAAVRMNF